MFCDVQRCLRVLSGARHQQSSEGMGSSPATTQKSELHWHPASRQVSVLQTHQYSTSTQTVSQTDKHIARTTVCQALQNILGRPFNRNTTGNRSWLVLVGGASATAPTWPRTERQRQRVHVTHPHALLERPHRTGCRRDRCTLATK
eukprot:scaffold2609_cov123-Isochrysis_galbana.AAC.1